MSRGLLVDTHILLWMRAAPDRLLDSERQALDKATARFVSAASFWEIGILIGLGRIGDDPRLYEVPQGFDLLPISPAHCQDLSRLPPIHRDPFDRMLIAQARTEVLALLTRDAKIADYAYLLPV